MEHLANSSKGRVKPPTALETHAQPAKSHKQPPENKTEGIEEAPLLERKSGEIQASRPHPHPRKARENGRGGSGENSHLGQTDPTVRFTPEEEASKGEGRVGAGGS
jgi:hypothetical protein